MKGGHLNNAIITQLLDTKLFLYSRMILMSSNDNELFSSISEPNVISADS